MSAMLIGVLAVVVAGGVLAVTAATPRVAALGLLIALALAPLGAEPYPGPLIVGVRMAGAVFASQLVWIALREAPRSTGPLGWPTQAALAAAAFVAGWAIGGTLGVPPGPDGAPPVAGEVARAAVGAAGALAVIAAPPIVTGRDGLRLGIGLLLLLTAVDLVRRATDPAASSLAEVSVAVLTVLIGAAVAWVDLRALRSTGDLALEDRAPAARGSR